MLQSYSILVENFKEKYETFSRSRDVKNNSSERPIERLGQFCSNNNVNLVRKRRAKAWRPAPFTALHIHIPWEENLVTIILFAWLHMSILYIIMNIMLKVVYLIPGMRILH